MAAAHVVVDRNGDVLHQSAKLGAYLTDEAMLMARSNVSFPEVRERAGRLLTPSQVEPGVPSSVFSSFFHFACPKSLKYEIAT